MLGERGAVGSVVTVVELCRTSLRGTALVDDGDVEAEIGLETRTDVATEVSADDDAGVSAPHAAAHRTAESNSPNLPSIHQVFHPKSHVADRQRHILKRRTGRGSRHPGVS